MFSRYLNGIDRQERVKKRKESWKLISLYVGSSIRWNGFWLFREAEGNPIRKYIFVSFGGRIDPVSAISFVHFIILPSIISFFVIFSRFLLDKGIRKNKKRLYVALQKVYKIVVIKGNMKCILQFNKKINKINNTFIGLKIKMKFKDW